MMTPPLSAFHCPHLLDELLAPQRVAVGLLALHQLALDHHLRGDAGVVGARLPQHVLAAHALEAAQHVLQRVVEGMARVQRARHVGRRDDDCVGLGFRALRAPGLESLGLHPLRVDARFDVGGLIGFLEHEDAKRVFAAEAPPQVVRRLGGCITPWGRGAPPQGRAPPRRAPPSRPSAAGWSPANGG